MAIECIAPAQPLSDLFRQAMATTGLDRLLRMVRQHLGMDVAFISRFRKKDRVLDLLDSATVCPLHPGQAIPLQEGYCLKIVRGELPRCIADTSAIPAAQAIPATHAIPIGAHLSVPIRLSDGRIYGTLCCFSYAPQHALDTRDLRILEAFAEVLSMYFDDSHTTQQGIRTLTQQIRSIMKDDALRIVYQPVYGMTDRRLRAFECLSRFDAEPRLSPDRWFALADQVGLGVELERHAMLKALDTLPEFPPSVMLGVNSSPALILSGALPSLFAARGYATSRIVLEITEHAVVRDYRALVTALSPLRALGVRLAVDDAGAGYASMSHILELEPEIIKLDRSLIASIDTDRKRRALAKGLTSFAHEIGSKVTAEGVETASDLAALERLGIDAVQGYLFSRPIPFGEALSLCAQAS
ncbi:Cyclic di-GMP phosphodiesterase Gmr [Pandoraea sputorum]|nr:Cyclic di-GMP phosphodiesterase Gmr [Pandoraea sputorum]